MRRRRASAEVIASGTVNADGSINAAGDGNWASRKTGTGRITIDVKTPNVRITSANGNPTSATVATTVVPVLSPTTASVEFWIVNTTATLVDTAFTFTIFGVLP